jgi:serine/threonine-protein kinase
MLAIGAFAVAAGAAFVVPRLKTPATPPQTSNVAEAAPPVGSRLVDEPLPPTNPQAAALYRRALRELRDGIFQSATRHFGDAARADPELAAAKLRYAILAEKDQEPAKARDALREASSMRERLSPRDRAILDAVTPTIQPQVPDFGETRARLDRLRAATPRDTEVLAIFAFLTSAAFPGDDTQHAVFEVADAILAIDPEMAAAWRIKIDWWWGAEGEAAAIQIADECLQALPDATTCEVFRAERLMSAGPCDELESRARDLIAREPDDPYAYWLLAYGSFAQERPVATLREILAQRWARLDPERRPRTELDDRMRVAVFTGDFSQAFADYAAAEKVLANEPSELEHAYAASIVLDAFAEAGQSADGTRFGTAYLERRGAWFPMPSSASVPDDYDLAPRMLAMLRRNGAIDATTLASRRSQWSSSWVVPGHTPEIDIWIREFAQPSETPAEAREALDRLPRTANLKPSARFRETDAGVGHVYLLAGRPADALPFLRSALRGCEEYGAGLLRTRVRDWLGQALEATGDSAGACAEYRVVANRWGHAKPRSITAEHAKGRLAALKCP